VANDKKVEVIITADASGVAKGVAVANTALGNLKTQLTSLDAAAAKAFSFSGLTAITVSATAAAAALVGAVKSAADYGDQLDNMSQRTGVAVEELSRLQYAAKLSDTSTEALSKGIGNLSKLMVGAAAGGAESGALFERFGISLRNTDGTIRGTSDVLYDLADVFATMPDGPQKTALAMEFFGKKLGQELIPLLNQGSEGLKAMADEAERLGLVLNSAQAKAAADFNDNLDRLGQLSKSVAVSIGNALIPALNNMLAKLNDANRADLSIWQILGALPKQGEDVATQLKQASAELEKLKAKRAELQKQNLADGGSTDTGAIENAIAAEEKRVEYLKLQNKRIAGDDEATAKERLNIAANLAREQAKLEQLKAIAAGKASADILKTDKDRVAEQIKDAEKLREALQKAWETSRKEALKAAEDAQKLLEKAAGVRTSATDKANELRNAGLSDEEKQSLALAQALDLQSQGDYYAAAAASAKLDGRTQAFETYQKQAEQFLDRAMKFAEASANPDVIEGVGEGQARLIESQARAKQAEAAALEAQATAQAETIKKLDADITDLKTKAASIEIKADITQAEGQIASLQAQLDKLSDKTVTVTMQTVSADINSAGLGEFARGGQIHGPGTKTSDSILARLSAGEYVVRAAAVDHYGAGILHRINNMQIPKFADGGMVGGTAASGATVNLSLDGRTYSMQAGGDVVAALTDAVRREALRKGGRR
jgi:hypothetical protein